MIFVMENMMINLLNMTARRMDTPQLFGAFHITASLLAAALAVLAAVWFVCRSGNEKDVHKILFFTGCILIVLEVYKQCFLYFIVNEGAFDFWFFPFQLCSVPMYLCLLLPVLELKARETLLTFMGGYTFVSAAAALIYPEDMLRPYLALTVHGFIWHGLLLFISLLIFITGCADASFKGLRNAAALFVILSIIAVIINAAAEYVMPGIQAAHPAIEHDWAAMFYLNPFHISPQPVISDIQKTAGIPAGLVLYMLAVMAAGSMFIKLFKAVLKK